jgi:hypothetical protein
VQSIKIQHVEKYSENESKNEDKQDAKEIDIKEENAEVLGDNRNDNEIQLNVQLPRKPIFVKKEERYSQRSKVHESSSDNLESK